MMNFVISDEILENLICVSCQKYLSVPPVKIYPGKYIKCGRCSRNGDTGVVSTFGILGEKSLFKCINRFDGCRQLLESSQVLDHEAECKTSEYSCPCCMYSEIPTFQLPNHFEKEHPLAVLRIPIFSVDLKGEPQSEFKKIFFYRFKDDLFVVLFRFHSMTNEIYLNAYYIGEERRAERIKQKFFVHCTGVELIMETKEKACVPFSKYGNLFCRNALLPSFDHFGDMEQAYERRDCEPSANYFLFCGNALLPGTSEGFSMKLTSLSMKQCIFIEMELDVSEIADIFTMQQPTNSAAPTCVKMTSTTSTITTTIKRKPKSTNTEEPIGNTARKKDHLVNLRNLSAVCYEKDLIFPRRLSLNTYFRTNYKEFSTDLDFYKLIKVLPQGGEVEIILPCFICSELNFSVNSYRKSVFLRNDQSYFWLCSPCYRFHKQNEPDKSRFSHACAVLEYDTYKYIHHFCFWGCATPLYYTDLPKHETDCVSQPTLRCPVGRCTHTGKLFEIEKHFSGKHSPTQLVSLRSTFITKLNRDDSYVFEWYVWTPPFFVLVKFSWKNARWLVNIQMCEAHPGVQPRVVLFDKEWEFLETVGSTEERKYIEDRKDVRIKCFLKCE